MSGIGVCQNCGESVGFPYQSAGATCTACGRLLRAEPIMGSNEVGSQSGQDSEPNPVVPYAAKTNPFAAKPIAEDENDVALARDASERNREVMYEASRIVRGFAGLRFLLFITISVSVLDVSTAAMRWVNGERQIGLDTEFSILATLVMALVIGALGAIRTVHGDSAPYTIGLGIVCLGVAGVFGWNGDCVAAGIALLMAWLYGYFSHKARLLAVLRRENSGAFDEYVFYGEDSIPRDRKTDRGGFDTSADSPSSGRLSVGQDLVRASWILGGALAALLFGTALCRMYHFPGDVSVIVGEFRLAWNAGDYPRIASLSGPAHELRWIERLEWQDEDRPWNGQPPKAGKGEYAEPKRGTVWVTFRTAKGPFRVLFVVEGNEWQFERMLLSELKK